MTVVRVLPIVVNFLTAEEAIFEPLIGCLIKSMLLLSSIVNLYILLYQIIVAKLSGVRPCGKGDLDISEEGIILIRLELFSQDGRRQLFPVVLLHVQILQRCL